MLDILGTLVLLIGLEIVLGVDNILVITIFVSRLEKKLQQKARIIGLSFALVARLILLFILLKLTGLTQPIFLDFSIRDMILIVGGLFLIYKAVIEIHHTVELKEEQYTKDNIRNNTFSSIIFQIVLLDIVFSIDSVITAIGLTDHIYVIIIAVVFSFIGLLFFAKPIGDYIVANPAIKILALSFLISIGITIFMEGMHNEIPKAYIYLPMGFALMVELLQMRYSKNRKSLNSANGNDDEK